MLILNIRVNVNVEFSIYEFCRWLPQSWCGSCGYWLGNMMLKALTWTDCESLKGRQSSRGAHHVRRLTMMQVCVISVAALWTAAVIWHLLSPRYHCLSRSVQSVLSFPAQWARCCTHSTAVYGDAVLISISTVWSLCQMLSVVDQTTSVTCRYPFLYSTREILLRPRPIGDIAQPQGCDPLDCKSAPPALTLY